MVGFNYNGTDYYYRKNLQGDILAIVNASGSVVAQYDYDAWGTVLSVTGILASTIGAINPFRYRGYYYDTETKLYYLNFCYYDPEVGRFINADDVQYLGENGDFVNYNLFAYCANNPISNDDQKGSFWNTIIGAVAGAIVGGITAAITGTDIAAGMVSGAISGAITGAAVDLAIATCGAGVAALAMVTVASGIGGAISSYTNQRMNGKSHDEVEWDTVAIDGLWGAIGGALSLGTSGFGTSACMTLKETFAQSGKEIAKQAVEDFFTSVVISFGTWLNGSKMNALNDQNATISSAY